MMEAHGKAGGPQGSPPFPSFRSMQRSPRSPWLESQNFRKEGLPLELHKTSSAIVAAICQPPWLSFPWTFVDLWGASSCLQLAPSLLVLGSGLASGTRPFCQQHGESYLWQHRGPPPAGQPRIIESSSSSCPGLHPGVLQAPARFGLFVWVSEQRAWENLAEWRELEITGTS